MRAFIKKVIKKIKLAVLWVRRILFAPNHFDVPLYTKLWMNVHGFLADQYVLYDLRGSRKKEYLSEFDWYRSRWIDEPFDTMLNNKVICSELLAPHVLVPEILVVKTKGEITFERDARGLQTPRDVVALISKVGSVFMKPISAGKGKGVYRLDAQGTNFLLDGQKTSEERLVQLFSREDGWFLCSTVQQSSYLDELYAHAANTVRLITLRDLHTHEHKVFFAVQRIGTDDTAPVDNGSRGGLVSCIDLETGRLSEARSLHSLDHFSVHPNSGAQIEGFCIPNWREIKECALRLAGLFPYVRFIAWDMLATDKGVCVIEANASSGVNIIQLWGPQRNGELGDFYRAQGVLK